MTSAAGCVCRVHGLNMNGEYECKSHPGYRAALYALGPHVLEFINSLLNEFTVKYTSQDLGGSKSRFEMIAAAKQVIADAIMKEEG